MAKIHNPQDQDGIFLINQETFSEEVSARSAADTLLQSNIDAEIQNRITAVENEKTRAEEAETALQTNINTEKERAITAESLLTTALQNEAARAQEAESILRNNLSAEIDRATTKENIISAIIDGETHIFSTDTLTDSVYSSSINRPSAINIHNSLLPAGIIKSIEIPNTNIGTAYHLSVKVVDSSSDDIVDYTSSNTSTTKWSFDNFIKKHNVSENVYYKLVLSNAQGNSNSLYFGTMPYNNGNFVNCGFGGSWPNPNIDLSAENGATGLPCINIEFEPNLNDSIKEVQTLAENNGDRLDLLHTNIESLNTAISEETTNREAAITTLVENLEAEISRAKNAEQNILDSTLMYDGTFGNWETPSNRKDKASCYYFKLIPTKTGYLKSLKILCRPDGTVAPANAKTYIKVTKEDENDILGQSINALPHALGATSLYEFDKSILIESGTTYKFIFTHEETGERVKACIASTKTANNGATPEELYGGGIQGDSYIQCQAIFEMTLLNRSQADSEKVAIIDTLPTVSDVENAISDRLINYSTTETINTKLSDYQLKSEIPTTPIIYKFNRDKNLELTFSETDEMLQDVITLTISNEGKIITANAVSDNFIVISQEINDSALVLTTLVNKPAESINTHIIVDSICDSAAYDNAQHICHVIPVSITI